MDINAKCERLVVHVYIVATSGSEKGECSVWSVCCPNSTTNPSCPRWLYRHLHGVAQFILHFHGNLTLRSFSVCLQSVHFCQPDGIEERSFLHLLERVIVRVISHFDTGEHIATVYGETEVHVDTLQPVRTRQTQFLVKLTFAPPLRDKLDGGKEPTGPFC